MEPNFRAIIGGNPRQLPQISTGLLTDTRIAIVGGAGSIGFSLARLLGSISNATIGLFDSDESRLHSSNLHLTGFTKGRIESGLIDIRNLESVRDVFSKFRPDIVIHAAALKHVGVLEKWPREGFLSNVLGTANICSVVESFEIKNFMFISTDKAVNPTSILGKTKLIGEYLTAGISSRRSSSETVTNVVRFGNVFLSRGSVMETFMFQIENNLPITISDMNASRYFIDLPEAATLIANSMLTRNEKISILDMGEPILIRDVIEKLKKYYKSDAGIIEIGLKPGEKLHEELFLNIDDSSEFLSDGVYSKNFERTLNFSDIINLPIPSTEDSIEFIEELMGNAKPI